MIMTERTADSYPVIYADEGIFQKYSEEELPKTAVSTGIMALYETSHGLIKADRIVVYKKVIPNNCSTEKETNLYAFNVSLEWLLAKCQEEWGNKKDDIKPFVLQAFDRSKGL